MSKNGWINGVGYVNKNPESGKTVIKIVKDVTLKAGQRILVQDFVESINTLVGRQLIDQAEADRRLEQFANTKAVLHVAPIDDK